jgi:hypothetical protein
MAVASTVISAGRLMVGGVQHALTGRTPDPSYQSLISLFCSTGGRSSDALSKLVSIVSPPYPIPKAEGILGHLDREALSAIQGDLDVNGYHVFDVRLPDAMCDKLVAFSRGARCRVRPPAAPGQVAQDVIVDAYDPANLIGTRYDFLTQGLVDNSDVQRIIADATLLAVAQAYLRSRPILDVLAMWWSAAFSDRPDVEAAQHFHFDMDRIKWLKFFIYLTDVKPENGPHCFIAGSHRTGGIPPNLLAKGYSRLTDDEVTAVYPKDRFIEFAAPRGTIIAEDTRGLHKGKNLERGDRLMLQLQFSNSLFGGYYPPTKATRVVDENLRASVAAYPAAYANYIDRSAAL